MLGLAEGIGLPPGVGSLGPLGEDGGVVEGEGLGQNTHQANPQRVALDKFFSRGRKNLHEVKSLDAMAFAKKRHA